jgi:hypothetical protein
MPTPQTIPARLTVVPLSDPVVERIGFAPDSAYLEACILPRLGPAGFLLYRHLAARLGRNDQIVVDLVEVAANLGLPPNAARHSPLVRTLGHLEDFGLGAWRPNGHYALRRAVAPLSDRQARRLPQRARSIHYRTMQARLASSGGRNGTEPTPGPGERW